MLGLRGAAREQGSAFAWPLRATGALHPTIPMLRAGLIGLPSTGKTTLFRLMTSAREGAKGSHAKAEAHVGISRVPDPRLDTLAAMFNPRKHTPATVEFADMAMPGGGGAKDLVDVAPFRNADALVHVLRAFRDPSVPHPAGSIDPARDAQTMADELILADLSIVERRLERLARDLKKSATPDLKREHEVLVQCQEALENGRPLRALGLSGDDSSACAASSSCRPSRCSSC